MNKRDFLAAAALGSAALPALAEEAVCTPKRSPVLLTITGAISKTNRGPLDPVMDQMMAKQKMTFRKAHGFDFPALAALPAVTIRPTLEYDKKIHVLRGPLLTNVLQAVGASGETGTLVMRAVDGYAPTISVAHARKYRFIVALTLDGRPMPLGGVGPLWALYEPERFPDMTAKPLDQRFALCPWALYHIDVQA